MNIWIFRFGLFFFVSDKIKNLKQYPDNDIVLYFLFYCRNDTKLQFKLNNIMQ